MAHNEVGGIVIAVTGTLYAVVLGFLTVVVWQKRTELGFLPDSEIGVLDRPGWGSAGCRDGGLGKPAFNVMKRSNII
jgi:hypothetical protein